MGSSALGSGSSIGRGGAVDRVCVDDGRAADVGGVLTLVARQ